MTRGRVCWVNSSSFDLSHLSGHLYTLTSHSCARSYSPATHVCRILVSFEEGGKKLIEHISNWDRRHGSKKRDFFFSLKKSEILSFLKPVIGAVAYCTVLTYVMTRHLLEQSTANCLHKRPNRRSGASGFTMSAKNSPVSVITPPPSLTDRRTAISDP